jgi:hypothetical protein
MAAVKKYERIISDNIPFFKDKDNNLYLWENNGKSIEVPFLIGKLGEGDIATINQDKETKDSIEEKITEWRHQQFPRARDQIRRSNAIASVKPTGIEAPECTDEKPKRRIRRTKKELES